MVKRRILIVDQDDQTQHTLAHALRRANFSVTCNPDPHAALAMLPDLLPDALIVATTLPYLDGFEFVRRAQDQAGHAHVPVIFVTQHISIEEQASTLTLGAIDYLAKPLAPAELIARLRTVFERPAHTALDAPSADEFTGDLRDLDVAALCNMMQNGSKSGTLTLQRAWTYGFVYFIDGQVIDAEVAQLHGAHAVYQLLRWHDGAFCMTFDVPDRPVALTASTHVLLLDGMHRFDTWSRWLTQLPPLESVLHRQPSAAPAAGGDATTDPVLNLVDGQRSIVHIVEASIMGDVETVEALARHLAAGRIALLPSTDPASPRTTDPTAPLPADPAAAPEHAQAMPWATTHAALLPGPATPPRPTLFYGSSARAVAEPPHPIDAPRSPEEAFGLPPAPRVDQGYLDAPLTPAKPWRRPLFWLWTTSIGSMLVGWLWALGRR